MVSFMTMQYVYFFNFRVRFGAVCRHKSSRCWKLTLSNVTFCSLSVRNYRKALFCLTFSDRELQVLLLNKLNFTHNRGHTITVHYVPLFEKIFCIQNCCCFFSSISENRRLYIWTCISLSYFPGSSDTWNKWLWEWGLLCIIR